MTLDQLTMSQMTVGYMTVGQITVSLAKWLLAKRQFVTMTDDQMTFGQKTVGEEKTVGHNYCWQYKTKANSWVPLFDLDSGPEDSRLNNSRPNGAEPQQQHHHHLHAASKLHPIQKIGLKCISGHSP